MVNDDNFFIGSATYDMIDERSQIKEEMSQDILTVLPHDEDSRPTINSKKLKRRETRLYYLQLIILHQ